MDGRRGEDRDWDHRDALARFAAQQVSRRRFLRGAAGTAAAPFAARAAAAGGAFTAFTPAAVGAAAKRLRQTGDSAEAAVAAAQQFKGTTLNVLYEAGLQAQDPINFSGPMWEELTGITINVVEKPFTELYSSPIADHLAGAGANDVLNTVPSFMPDFVAQGVVEPLQPFIDRYMNPADLDDFHPLYRGLTRYAGQIYGLFDDGDPLILYYRRDLFDDPTTKDAFRAANGRDLAPPTTWAEYDAIQAFFTERGGGTLYGGASQRAAGQVYEWFLGEFRTNGGRFFDDATLDATLASEAGVATLARMVASNESMPPGAETFDFVAILTAWMAGELAMIGGTWPPIGRWSEGYGAGTKQLEFVPASTVADKVGYAVLPGGHSQHAGGFLLSVAADSQNKEAAYLFAQWMNSPSISLQRCMLPYALRDPFRLSHYRSAEYRALWPNAGAYLDTLQAAADGALIDLIMPASAEYSAAIDQAVTAAMAGTDPAQALADADAAADAITDRLGRDAQKAAYQEFVALPGSYPETTGTGAAPVSTPAG